jgi:hypothetical protein
MNARIEMIRLLRMNSNIKCAKISTGHYYLDDNDKGYEANLKVDHTLEDLQDFLNQLDFEYDSGYGGQELFGTVWFDDGTWAERGEYDGSEWWSYLRCPSISEELL